MLGKASTLASVQPSTFIMVWEFGADFETIRSAYAFYLFIYGPFLLLKSFSRVQNNS